jgi:cob(I)alamin adenosyltransferase
MKIYTKTGDQGETSLLGGSRVAKYHLRIEAYGTVDELNAAIGLIRAHGLADESSGNLQKIQGQLFTAGAQLATEDGNDKVKIPKLKQSDIEFLEKGIDMEEELPPMKNFILPGGNPSSAQAHVARCVCRRAERIVLHLASESEVPNEIPVFLNRLSDFLFVLSRKISKDAGVEETPWISNK